MAILEKVSFPLVVDANMKSETKKTYKVTALVRPAPRPGTIANGIAQLLVSLEVIQVNILALVRLVGIAFYSLNTTVLALDLVLVGALLAEAVPPLAVIVSSSTLLSPGRLCRLAYGNF